MYFAHKMDYRLFGRFSRILLAITLFLLAITITQGQEEQINSANRWLSLLGFSFQPSDLAKFAIIVYLAQVLTRKQEIIRDFKQGFLPVMAVVMLTCGLIAPANLSTAVLIFITALVLMYISGIKGRFILGIVLAGVVGLILLFSIAERSTTWENRLDAWKARMIGGADELRSNSEHHYQAIQSNIAIATGGLTGLGAGKSLQRNYLPHPYSDFIFAIIVEEYGLLGGLLVLALYLVILVRAVAIVTVSKTFGALLAAGLAFMITTQAIINMAVTVGLLPVTGLPLPLISMGGTSVLFTCLSFGVILSVSREAAGSVRNLRQGIAPTRPQGNRPKPSFGPAGA
jgi:cell division protein FtsW